MNSNNTTQDLTKNETEKSVQTEQSCCTENVGTAPFVVGGVDGKKNMAFNLNLYNGKQFVFL